MAFVSRKTDWRGPATKQLNLPLGGQVSDLLIEQRYLLGETQSQKSRMRGYRALIGLQVLLCALIYLAFILLV